MNIFLLSIFIILLIIYFNKNLRSPKKVIQYALAGGIIFGMTALILGMVGASIFYQGDNLAPMVGILITGPIGFMIGLIAGVYYGQAKKRKKENEKL